MISIDTTVLEVIKENIVSVLKTVVHQKTLESIVRKDLFTGLYSEEYLYGEGKKIIDQYTISTMCMFKIINIQQINQEYCRELGNKVITQISNYIRENISSEYVFVRYMGPKFVIAFSGVEASGVADFLNEIKEKVENMKIQLTEEEIEHLNLDAKLKNKLSKNVKEIAIPKLNFVISSYYKGTGLEEVLKKLEKYLECDKTMNFKVEREENTKCREVLKEVYQSLVEKGYNPINQIVGYILSGDPTYITSHNDARNKIRTIERDELLEKMVKNYIGLED